MQKRSNFQHAFSQNQPLPEFLWWNEENVQEQLVLCWNMIHWMSECWAEFKEACYCIFLCVSLSWAGQNKALIRDSNYSSVHFILAWFSAGIFHYVDFICKFTLSFLYLFSLTPFSGSSWTSRLSGNCLFNLCLCVSHCRPQFCMWQ